MLSTRAALQLIDTRGRFRCPVCGRYARELEVGEFISGMSFPGDPFPVRFYYFGHLPGFGCNSKREAHPYPVGIFANSNKHESSTELLG